MNDDLQQFLTDRNAALRTLDIEWARKMCPGASSEYILLLALHKARYSCTAIEPELRHASAAWLREGGHGAMCVPLLPEGELPE
jgi:hypothetical protein